MVDVLERCSTALLWAFEGTIFNSLARVLAFLVPQNFFLRKEFRAAKAAREVARMRPNVIHIVTALFVALKTEIFDVDDLNLVHNAQVIRRLNLCRECSQALAAWVPVNSFLGTQSAVLLDVFPQKRAGIVVGRTFRAGVAWRSIHNLKVLLKVDIFLVDLLVVVPKRCCRESFAAYCAVD